MVVLETPVTGRGDLLFQRSDVFSSAALANRPRQTSSRAKLHIHIVVNELPAGPGPSRVQAGGQGLNRSRRRPEDSSPLFSGGGRRDLTTRPPAPARTAQALAPALPRSSSGGGATPRRAPCPGHTVGPVCLESHLTLWVWAGSSLAPILPSYMLYARHAQ